MPNGSEAGEKPGVWGTPRRKSADSWMGLGEFGWDSADGDSIFDTKFGLSGQALRLYAGGWVALSRYCTALIAVSNTMEILKLDKI
jgi:hypothetical protein